jgi:catechol-2,3-dioxygenase
MKAVETTGPDRRTPVHLGLDRLAGLVVEVANLVATRAFYDRIFEGSGGAWHTATRSLTYCHARQKFEFVQRPRPRTLGHTGQHTAYHVPAERFEAVIHDLAEQGFPAAWWREDHPAERTPTGYLLDPSGNCVQLMAGAPGAQLVGHAAIEVHDLELAEPFYVKGLGGQVDYYHGWRMADYAEAKAWEEGRDACTPWTRRFDVRYWDKLRVARPNMQLFVRFGSSVLGLILATEHHQEPPEEVLRGTPRVVLHTNQPTSDVEQHLSGAGVRFESAADGHVFLRDPAGNYVELDCSRG